MHLAAFQFFYEFGFNADDFSFPITWTCVLKVFLAWPNLVQAITAVFQFTSMMAAEQVWKGSSLAWNISFAIIKIEK